MKQTRFIVFMIIVASFFFGCSTVEEKKVAQYPPSAVKEGGAGDLRLLQDMRDMKVITQGEYDALRQKMTGK